MYFQHLYAKGVKLSDLGAMQRYLAAPTSLRGVNSVQKNHSIEDLTPVKLNARVKARIDLREEYFSDAVLFFQEKYGKENVLYSMCHVNESNPHIHVGILPITSDGRLSASSHVNESNPHIHVGILPITSDGRLSASSLFTSKSVKILRTEFHKAVASKYGLECGKSHESNHLEEVKSHLEELKTKLKVLAENMDGLEQKI